MKWRLGRLNTGYKLFTLIKCASIGQTNIDCHIIKYVKGSSIPPHTDKAYEGKKHYRLNIEIWSANNGWNIFDVPPSKTRGGQFVCPTAIINTNKIKLFRSDIHEHSVTEITDGVRYVFSIGVVK